MIISLINECVKVKETQQEVANRISEAIVCGNIFICLTYIIELKQFDFTVDYVYEKYYVNINHIIRF
jgi:hypothetical protein